MKPKKVKIAVQLAKIATIGVNELKCSATCLFHHVPFGRPPCCEIEPGYSVQIKDGNRTTFCLRNEVKS